MKPDATNTTKRRLLRALAGGGAVTAAPDRWVAPIVKSIVLPVHAQTSPPLCDPLTFPDLVVACSTSPDPGEQEPFVVEETADGCPTLAPRPFEPQPTATLLTFNRRRFFAGASTGTVFASIFQTPPAGGGTIVIRSLIDNCDETGSALNCDGFDQTPFEVIGTLGGSYTLTAERSCDPDTGVVSISNIRIV